MSERAARVRWRIRPTVRAPDTRARAARSAEDVAGRSAAAASQLLKRVRGVVARIPDAQATAERARELRLLVRRLELRCDALLGQGRG